MATTMRLAACASLLLLCACSEQKEVAYAALPACDTANWLGLPDSLSCPHRVDSLCAIPGLQKVTTNVCRVDSSAYLYSLITGLSFASELDATLNANATVKGPPNQLIKFEDLAAKNDLTVVIQYKTDLQAKDFVTYKKTYHFAGR